MERFRFAGVWDAGSVVRLEGAATVPIAPHAPGFQARDAHLPLLLRDASPVAYTTASDAMAEVCPLAAAAEGTAHA